MHNRHDNDFTLSNQIEYSIRKAVHKKSAHADSILWPTQWISRDFTDGPFDGLIKLEAEPLAGFVVSDLGCGKLFLSVF